MDMKATPLDSDWRVLGYKQDPLRHDDFQGRVHCLDEQHIREARPIYSRDQPFDFTVELRGSLGSDAAKNFDTPRSPSATKCAEAP